MEFFNYKLTEKDKEYCSVHAKKMAEGFSTYSFKNDEKQSLDVYNIGKIGEFAFFNRELKYKLNQGDVIMFPSTFMYPHEIMPITKGTRYSIITWFN